MSNNSIELSQKGILVISGGLRFGGPSAKYLESPFPMWISQKSFGPYHAKILRQRHVSCTSEY